MALRFMALQPFTVCPFKPRTHGSGWFLPQVLANQRFNKATRVIPPLATVVKHRPFSWQPLSPPPFSFSFSSFSPASGATRGETPLSYLFPFLIFSSPILFLFPPEINPRHQRSFSLSLCFRLGKEKIWFRSIFAPKKYSTRFRIESISRRNILIFKSSQTTTTNSIHLEMLKMLKNYLDFSMKGKRSNFFFSFFSFLYRDLSSDISSPLTYVSSFHVSILYLFEPRKSMTFS